MAESNLALLSAQQTVRRIPKASGDTPPAAYGEDFWTGLYSQPDLLPLWQSRYCDMILRAFRRSPYNTLVTGASDQLKHRVAYTPYEVSSKKYARRIQDMLMNAEMGEGFEECLSLVLEDYFWSNNGGFFEVIGYGDPDEPIIGMPTDIGYLDSLRMWPTGDPEFPWVYERDDSIITQDAYGKPQTEVVKRWVRMHRTRIGRLIANPQGEAKYYKRGVCYGFKILSTADVQIKMTKYQGEKLSGLPPSGIVTVNGIKSEQFEAALRRYQNESRNDGNQVFRNLMRLVGMNPLDPIKIEITPFANMPDHFDFAGGTAVHVNFVALALGDDPQNIWPLTGQALGTGTQSRVLHAKGAMKTEAVLRTKIQRFLNIHVLPRSAEFKWKFSDPEQDQQTADNAQKWFAVGEAMVSLLPGDDTERRALAAQMVASHVDAVGDVLLDEDGNVRLPSEDVKDETENTPPPLPAGDNQIVQGDAAPGAPAQNPQDTTTTDSETTVARSVSRLWGDGFTKDWDATRAEFVRNVADLIQGGQDKEIAKRRFGVVMRAQLRRLGTTAYKDGLADGGVQTDTLDDDDQAAFNTLLAEQSAYVKDFADTVFGDDVTIVNYEARADMWANKSLQAFYQAGVLSADANGMYLWHLGPTEQHCKTCAALAAQIHRYKDYYSRDMMPGSSKLACGGHNCKCTLKRQKKARARGRFPSG